MTGSHESVNGDRVRLTVPVAILIFALGAFGTVGLYVWRAAETATELRLKVEEQEKEIGALHKENDQLRERIDTEVNYRTNTRERLIGLEGRVTAAETNGWRPVRR